MFQTADILVAKLWSLGHMLRDDGVTYHQHVAELAYLQVRRTETSKHRGVKQ